MLWIGHLDDLGADHRDIGRDRHAIIEEARILHAAVLAIAVFLIERPADALDGATLKLTFDLHRVNRLAGVLHDGIALDVDAAGLPVDLDIRDVQTKTWARAGHVHLRVARNRAVGGRRLRRDVLDRKRLEVADVGACGLAVAVFERDGILRHAPDAGGAFAQFANRLAGRVDHDHATGEGRAAAGGDAVVAQRMGVGHDGAPLVDWDA